MGHLSAFVERLRFRYAPPIAEWLASASAYRARRLLRKTGPIGILVDNNLLAHATTHKTARISLGKQQWGPHEIDAFTTARVSAYPADSATREYESITYLPGLISLFRSGHIRLLTSALLQYEQFYQPSGRFRGGGWFDYNLMAGVQLESVDGYTLPDVGPSWMRFPPPRDQLRQRLERLGQDDPHFASLVAVMGKKNSQDAWHICTAERFGLCCFLTTDFSLLATLDAQRGTGRVKALKTEIMTPAQLGTRLGIRPIAPHLFSYTDASFPVRADIVLPEKKRRNEREAE